MTLMKVNGKSSTLLKFCINCRYYDGGEMCYNSNNIQTDITPIKVKTYPLKRCTFLNKNNNCKWFKRA